jgi:hypothetical protein
MNRYEEICLLMSKCLDSGLKPAISPNGILTKYDKDRKPADFLNDIDYYPVQFELCRLWLQDAKFIQSFSGECASYTYKHTVQGASEYYVCNGALLLAARSMNLQMRCEPNSPNAELKISKKWHKAFRQIQPSSTGLFQKKVIDFLADPSLDHISFVREWRKHHGDRILTMRKWRSY